MLTKNNIISVRALTLLVGSQMPKLWHTVTPSPSLPSIFEIVYSALILIPMLCCVFQSKKRFTSEVRRLKDFTGTKTPAAAQNSNEA